jgi:hypothetical protein
MKTVITVVIIFAAMGLLWAQSDRGGVGRAGGSRTEHETQQSAALAQNNDPRFAGYRDLISKRLDKSVRQLVTEYDRTLQKKIQLSPQEFLAVQLAAKETHLNAEVVAASVGSSNASGKQGHATAQVLVGEDFGQRLSKSLQRLGAVEPASAEDMVRKATAAVSLSPTS